VHGASFRVLSLSGTPPAAYLAGRKDVVLVEDEAKLLVPLITRQSGSILLCITVTSSNTKMRE
jgi:FtsP/CotA-like multicopper oxidase with cupredoxin domain